MIVGCGPRRITDHDFQVSSLVMRTIRTLAVLALSLSILAVGLVASAPADAQDAPAALVSRQGELRVMSGDGVHSSRIFISSKIYHLDI
jgi:hypothetical protein